MTLYEWLSRVLLAVLFVVGVQSSAFGQSGSTPEAAEEEEQQAPIAYSWRDGKTTFTLDAAEVGISNRVQVLSLRRHGGGRPTERSLTIPRARTEFAGWLYSEHLTYEAQFDWAEGPELQDLYLALDLLRDGTLELKAGQFKVPFSRQRLTSSGSQQFVDRAVMVDEFTEGRDIGVQLSGLVSDDRVEYRLGVFNGAGQNSLAAAAAPQYNGRVVFQPFGELKYAEGDVTSSAVPLLAMAGNIEYQGHGNSGGAEARTRMVVGADVAVHFRGLSMLGEMYRRDVSHESAPTARSTGYLIQAGYFVIPQRFEVAGRLATWSTDEPVAVGTLEPGINEGRREIGLALGYFLNNHNLKLQSDVRRLELPGGTRPASEVRIQLQVVF